MLTEYGEGLSYSSFRYSNLRLSDSVLSGSGTMRATVQVTNTSKRAGKEAVLWFLTDEVGRITRPVRLLKHFEKREFQPGESRDMVFEIQPQKHLSYPNAQGQAQLEDGYFTLRVGDQARRFRYAGPAASTSAPMGRRAPAPNLRIVGPGWRVLDLGALVNFALHLQFLPS
ncbi:fibronectin type III-like domain-contianing protein [Hymenobacter cellulosilyticus]|uniref:Fibronectin type III-like domain-contianing protein n=1 Tax=Hymenobacter cellulosilyticus TaxID=2932248 RepID=A0A8T9Q7M3_9BACT|nr:fibronectin type III-like domain-contianing protein [Hymenobacter cellulosilyticus]UOQ73135.1 fibronectin type III-like domain-contianing protein [Hymenobacter cellulosilyticus]